MISSRNMATQDPAKVIRKAFRQSRMSIKQFAELSGTPYSGVHRFINVDADVRTSTLRRLANALGLDLVVQPKQKR